VILLLGDAIYNVHAKDTRPNPHVVRTDGILDPKSFGLDRDRAWNFRTIGYGNDDRWWTTFVSNLRMVGYEGVLAIEHEDPLFDPVEGFEKAVRFLGPMLPQKPRTKLWYE
jgi:sugar phosphate isomerase/epimerase